MGVFFFRERIRGKERIKKKKKKPREKKELSGEKEKKKRWVVEVRAVTYLYV